MEPCTRASRPVVRALWAVPPLVVIALALFAGAGSASNAPPSSVEILTPAEGFIVPSRHDLRLEVRVADSDTPDSGILIEWDIYGIVRDPNGCYFEIINNSGGQSLQSGTVDFMGLVNDAPRPVEVTLTLSVTDRGDPQDPQTLYFEVNGTVEAGPALQASVAWLPVSTGGDEVLIAAIIDSEFPWFTYAWDLGDGTTATGPRVVHRYAQPGSYAVTVEVSDCFGREVVAAAVVSVPGVAGGGGLSPWTAVAIGLVVAAVAAGLVVVMRRRP